MSLHSLLSSLFTYFLLIHLLNSTQLNSTQLNSTQLNSTQTGPTVSLADIEHESSCLYDETPIMTETTGLKENSVEFTVKNTWPTDAVSALSIHFINADGEVQCDTFEDMNGFESTSAIEALCVNGLAEVGIQIHSTGINSKI
jgi:hypothetical protein